MVPNERSSALVAVTCTCGKSLRAKVEQVGTEVRCWSCHNMVLVPDRHEGQRVARELSDGALVVIKGPGLNSVLVGALVVMALLAIPSVGVWCSAIALAMGASAYIEIIRQVSRGPSEAVEPSLLAMLLPKSPGKILLCCAMAVGTVVPLWIRNAGYHQSPHWDGVGRAIAGVTWFLLPLLILVAYTSMEDGKPLGFRRGVKLIAKHPFATFLALAVVPMTLVVVEACLGLTLYLVGNLPFFSLDYMPMPLLAIRNEAAIVYSGIPFYHMIDYRSYPVAMFHHGYLDGIRHGYSFVSAIPASLSLSNRADLDAAEAIGLIGPSYLILRLIFTMAIVTSLLAAFSIQARWLGSIPALERRKLA